MDSRGKCHIRWNAKTYEEEEGGGGLRREKPAPANSEKQLPSPADGERAREAALAPSARRRRTRTSRGGDGSETGAPTGHLQVKIRSEGTAACRAVQRPYGPEFAQGRPLRSAC